MEKLDISVTSARKDGNVIRAIVRGTSLPSVKIYLALKFPDTGIKGDIPDLVH